MRTLYIECSMGAAGDMLTGALCELMPDPDGAIARLNELGLHGVEFARERSVKCGIVGTHIKVTVHGHEEHEHEHTHEHHHEHTHGHHHHASMADIDAIISSLRVSDAVKRHISAVYRIIADAESAAHGVPVTEIHFHEVGALDAIADVAAVCMLIEELAPDRIVASPVHVGSGTVRCAHGVLPVPVPAVARILEGVPTYGGAIASELCTPTGAALLRHFAESFGPMPMMAVSRTGYGMGRKDFEAANCVRAMIGDEEDERDRVWELSCTVDDMSAEAAGFAIERFFDDGALEAFTIPLGMKKSRPGMMICVLCREEDKERLVRSIFRHTTTIGLRESTSARRVLDREMSSVETRFGSVRLKRSRGYGTTRQKFEHDDLARIAREQGISIFEAAEEARRAQHDEGKDD